MMQLEIIRRIAGRDSRYVKFLPPGVDPIPPTGPPNVHQGNIRLQNVVTVGYSIIIGTCHVRPNCPYTWILKFDGVEIERGEEKTRELAVKDANDARASHEADNPK